MVGVFVFFFQAEDGIRDKLVTGVQTCALPILATFGMEIILSRRVAREPLKKLESMEREPEGSCGEEPGLRDFLKDPSLGGDATGKEIEFLRKLRFMGKRPTALYYYRELQNLRDPFHFTPPVPKRTAASRS